MKGRTILITGLLAALLMGCGQTRHYTPVERKDLKAALGGVGLADIVRELNSEMECDIWAVGHGGARLAWAADTGVHSGIAHLSGDVDINERVAGRGAIMVKVVVLHELGHTLGYDHVAEPYNIMSEEITSNFPLLTLEDQIEAFLNKVEKEQICLNQL